jgi:hypothetical protein
MPEKYRFSDPSIGSREKIVEAEQAGPSAAADGR